MTKSRILRASAEMVAMFALLLAIDLGLLSGRAFDGVEPNPYWLPVLIMALTYGTGAAVSAAGTATAIWLIAPHDKAPGSDELQWLLHVSLLPMLWVIVALVIGEVTALRKSKIEEHELRSREAERKHERIADALAHLADVNRALQVRIATENQCVAQAIDVAIGLMEADQTSQIKAVERLIALAAQTEDFTFFDVRGNRIVPRFRGRAPGDRSPELARAALKKARMAGSGDQDMFAENGSVSFPTRSPDGEKIGGLLLLNGLPSPMLTEAKIAELRHVAESLKQISALRPVAHSPIRSVRWNVSEGKVA